MAEILVSDITSEEVDGNGVFDKLMLTISAQLENEFKKTRLTGPDYAKVLLGSIESALSQSIGFILGKQQADKQAELISQQTLNAIKEGTLLDEQLLKLRADKALVEAQETLTITNNTNAGLEGLNIPKQGILLDKQAAKIDKDILIGDAQEDAIRKDIEKAEQERLLLIQNVLVAQQEVLFSIAKVTEMEQRAELTTVQVKQVKQEILNSTIQGTLLIQQAKKLEQEVLVEQQNVLNMEQQVLKSAAEVSMLGEQELKIAAEINIAEAQLTSMTYEDDLTIAKKDLTVMQKATEFTQELKLDAEIVLMGLQGTKTTAESNVLGQQLINLGSENLKILKETEIMGVRLANETLQGNVLTAQANKLEAETTLMVFKQGTEEAQFRDYVGGIEVTGVIGAQKLLYAAQKEGFKRDAEQKAAKILADTWNVRRSSAPETPASVLNQLHDASIGAVIEKLKAGIEVVASHG